MKNKTENEACQILFLDKAQRILISVRDKRSSVCCETRFHINTLTITLYKEHQKINDFLVTYFVIDKPEILMI